MAGFVEPKTATTGVFTAHATCIGPVSFVTRRSHSFRSAASCKMSVFPVTSIALFSRLLFISPASRLEFVSPKIIISHLLFLYSLFARSPNLSGSHCFAFPLVELGFIPTRNFFEPPLFENRNSRAHLTLF